MRPMDAHLVASGIAPSLEEHLRRILYRLDCAQIIQLAGQAVGLLKVSRDLAAAGDARTTQIGGEPHYKCAASRFGEGLSREALKDIFAAAPSWCDTLERSSNPNAWNLPTSQGVASIGAPYLQRLIGADMR